VVEKDEEKQEAHRTELWGIFSPLLFLKKKKNPLFHHGETNEQCSQKMCRLASVCVVVVVVVVKVHSHATDLSSPSPETSSSATWTGTTTSTASLWGECLKSCLFFSCRPSLLSPHLVSATYLALDRHVITAASASIDAPVENSITRTRGRKL